MRALEPLGEDLLTAVQRASEEGIISDSQIYELFGFARGGLLAHSSAVRKGISAWMAPFRLTEQANRFATFMAAFEAGKSQKLTGAELYNFARDAVDQTQAIYGPINRQPWARNSVGHALFTFRAFPLMMSELWLRLPPHSAPWCSARWYWPRVSMEYRLPTIHAILLTPTLSACLASR